MKTPSACEPSSSREGLPGAALLLALLLALLVEAPDVLLAPLLATRALSGGVSGGLHRQLTCPAGVGAGAGVLAGAGGACGVPARPLELDLRVIILSRAAAARQRAAVRLASLSTVDAAAFRVAYFFLLSRPPGAGDENALVRELEEESAAFGDLLFADDGIEDMDLSQKVWLAMRDVAARADAPFLLKVDDDHMVFYDRLLRELQALPRHGLLWGRRGSGAINRRDKTAYTNSAYLMSEDVLQAVAADARASSCPNPVPGEDFCVGRSATTAGRAKIVDDKRWHNDDDGDPRLCLCRRWTLEDNTSIVVHHVRPQLMEAFATNKSRFAAMRYPDRNY